MHSVKPHIEIRYIDAPPIHIEKDSTELRPILERYTQSILYAEMNTTEPPLVDSAGDIQALQAEERTPTETELDWNVERTYKEVVLDSDTLGRAEVTATVQYNTLTSLHFDYTPRQREVIRTIHERNRAQGYAIMNATTNNASGGIGLKYGRVGVHAIGGYDYRNNKSFIGGGILVFF